MPNFCTSLITQTAYTSTSLMVHNPSDGMSENMKLSTDESCAFRIQTQTINKDHLLDLVDSTDEGARLVFIGLVRDYNKAHSGVTKIDYHCYREMAEKEGLKILQLAKEKYKVARIFCVHRIGMLVLQDIAIKLEIASGHRLATLHACEYIMDQIKLLLPIWKKEYYGEKGVWL